MICSRSEAPASERWTIQSFTQKEDVPKLELGNEIKFLIKHHLSTLLQTLSSPPVQSPTFARLKIIGVLGGVASGKSWVARCLTRCGAGMLDADRAGHEVLKNPAIHVTLRARWGEEIFGPDGRIDRKAIARRVFAPAPDGPRERTFLEQLLHPEIARRLEQQVQSYSAAGFSAAVLDAPLILEAGWDRFCDCLIFVDAPRAVRLKRAAARGLTDEEFAAREATQQSPEDKRARAETVIDNSGSPQQTQAQVEQWWASYCGKYPVS